MTTTFYSSFGFLFLFYSIESLLTIQARGLVLLLVLGSVEEQVVVYLISGSCLSFISDVQGLPASSLWFFRP
jgi:hypothetical protein